MRAFFEPRFGQDLSHVRVHTDGAAQQSARDVNALAYTVGPHVVFGAGRYAPGTLDGQRLLAHELTHVVQQRSYNLFNTMQRQPATPSSDPNTICYDAAGPQPSPTARDPQRHPTYEQWLASFRGLATFKSNDTIPGRTAANRFNVLGRRGRRYGDASATAADQPVPVTGRPSSGEEFIDHPTDAWVRNCLPDNLRATAYQLPADCADIAVILRHVWLAAHHRTESYNGWVVGDAAGNANQTRARGLIGGVFSGNVSAMVNPYASTAGATLTDFESVKNLLHPGDILVWEHRKTARSGRRVTASRTGGHTQTITHITRGLDGEIDDIRVLQGNQPIFSDAARAILQSRGERNTDPDSPEGERLRNLPGRRVEADDAISTHNIVDPVSLRNVWGQIDSQNTDGSVKEYTVLLAAGPPRAASRPATRRIGGLTIRRISDWFGRLRSAALSSLYGVLEAALLEARSIIDGGHTLTNSDAQAIGTNAGENVWDGARQAVGRKANDTGYESHFEPLHRMRAVIRALGGIEPHVYHGNPAAETEVRDRFTEIDSEFNLSARGGSSLSFNRRLERGGELVKVLVTGFDPFGGNPPPAGDWNPSGAAAIAMDGSEVSLGGRNKAAVEGVVYPVSFEQFDSGIVERMVSASQADAVLTVSLMDRLSPTGPVQVEQFAVGMHRLQRLQPHQLFPTESAGISSGVTQELRGVAGGGPAIIGTQADLAGIALDTEQRDRRGWVIVPKPTISSEVTFRMRSVPESVQFQAVVGITPSVRSQDVTVSDPQMLQRIIANSVRISDARGNTADIAITLGTRSFRVTILEGPGGDFLSNEVAYRTQRLLQQQGSTAVSFHTHVPPAEPAGTIVPEARGRARTTALRLARAAITRLVTTLRNIVRAVATRVLAQRHQSSGP